MDDLAFMKPRDRLQADVRVRGHVHGFPFIERQRPEPVQETPWPDKATILDRQSSRDRQRSEAQRTVRIGFDGRHPRVSCDGNRLARPEFRVTATSTESFSSNHLYAPAGTGIIRTGIFARRRTLRNVEPNSNSSSRLRGATPITMRSPLTSEATSRIRR